MMLFRSATANDLPAICQLAKHSGIGMTTLPDNPDFLAKRLARAEASFKKDLEHPENEYYLFVLEDPNTHKIVGTSAIEANVGYDLPFYSYKITSKTQHSESLQIKNDYQLLTVSHDNEGHSELCTLFLEPQFRHNGNGLLLSRARFLFIANQPERFDKTIIAELRGVSDINGYTPFWNHVGEHFFHMPFTQADQLTMTTDKQFIADLLPEHPLYVNLLPKEAQQVIGRPNHATIPAMNILLAEGFQFNNYIDIFDAGPTLIGQVDNIKTIALSLSVTVSAINDHALPPSTPKYLIANTRLNFRATINSATVDPEQKSCVINQQTAHLLQVKVNDSLRVSLLHPEQLEDKA